ncbi:uncharacterized protein LOC117131069 [Brassica rapa]|uniref:uncharacterized protein LOC117131069 n=1 Tax=Brassica campestris TaxID=3711 RepID=UPI00142DEB68|nr:uncharacterized protein LOC117131069 [Brassica rapa]
MIDIEAIIDGIKVFMTFVYGDPVLERRDEVWERLTRFSTTKNGPWFMIGDFNEITCHNEKTGGRQRPDSSFLPFKQMLNDCGMLEFPFTGDMLSWVGKRAGGSTVRCRLDRAVGNADWHEKFPHSTVKYMRLWGSDHRPILADILIKPTRRSRKFKFDKRWLDNEDLRQVILDGWKSPDLPPNANIMEHIASCRRALSEWRKQNNVNSAKLVEELKEKVEGLYADDNATTEEIAAALKELSHALKAEEMFWKQKSRVFWLREGDRNTKFFHALTKQRRARNKITQLLDENGNIIEDEEGLVAIATSYFRQIFESSIPEEIAEALAQVPTTITGAMNDDLTAPVSEWEVKLALFAMHPEKAPGPDGMTALFYQKFWDIVKEDLTLMVNKFLFEGTMANGLNDTNICLIPKISKPNAMTQFRPISLCNVSYKIISKVLCQRLKKVLPGLISETQSAFVAGRQISDNVMIAQELFHALRTKPSGRNKRMAIKTDMSKAYDRMEWSFIEAVLRKMGFSETWTSWVMRCITSVKYKVLMNGEPRGNIIPEVMKVVRKYGQASGQCINFDKSSLLFGKRINANTRQEIKDALGIQNEGGMGTYLGIPEDISGSKCKLFAFLKDKLMHRVNGWTGRWLSKGGKEVLIKSILLALPTYVMSTFLLPLEICENLASAIAQFWWSSNPPKRGIHWAKWEKVCRSREEGGIGFRLIHEFNLALLAKQLWRLVQFPDSLVARVLRGRYYRLSSPLRVGPVSSPSYVWTSISAARKLLLLGIRQKIHSGYEVKVWEDPWIPSNPARPAAPIAPVMNPNMRVSDLIDQGLKDWDVGLLESYVHPEDIPLIRSLAISSTHRRDSFCWNFTRSGQYTVKSGYWVAQNLLKLTEEKEVLEPSITKLQAFAWKLKAPTKMCHLMWQLLTGHVAVTRNLVRRNMRCDNYCPRCGEAEETVTHAIFECPPARQVWSLSSTPTCPNIFPVSSVYTNMDYLFWRKNSIMEPEQDRDPYPWIIWYIWKARNEKLFRGIDRDPLELVRHAESECHAWFEANEVVQAVSQDTINEEPQAVCLGNICLLDGSWTLSANFSGCGWTLMDSSGNSQLMGTKNFPRRESALHSEVEALRWAMESMLQHSTCQSFGTDCKELISMVKDPQAWPSFATELERIETLQICFPDFNITYVPRAQNQTADFLAKTARSFRIDEKRRTEALAAQEGMRMATPRPDRLDVDSALGGLCIIAGETIRHSLLSRWSHGVSWRCRSCRLFHASRCCFVASLGGENHFGSDHHALTTLDWSFLRSFDPSDHHVL